MPIRPRWTRVNDAERDLIQDGEFNGPKPSRRRRLSRLKSRRQCCPGAALSAAGRCAGSFASSSWMRAPTSRFCRSSAPTSCRLRGVDLKNTGWLASLPLIGGALGGYVGGWLNEWMIALTGNRRWSRSGVGFVGKAIGCAMLLLVSRQDTATAAAVMLMLAKFFGDWSQPTVWGTCTDIGGRFSATVFSIINTAGTIGGMVMPLVFGWLLDRFTRVVTSGDMTTKITDWDPLFYLLAGMYLSSGLFWLLVDCTKPLERKPDA